MNPLVRSGPKRTGKEHSGGGIRLLGAGLVGIQGMGLHSGIKLGTQEAGWGMM